jgi:PleD family two-component response regulator
MSDSLIKVLLIEDNPGDAKLIEELLDASCQGCFLVEIIGKLSEGIKKSRQFDADVILLDLSLPDSMGMETLVNMREKVQDIPIIVLTGLNDEEIALEAVQNGAQDYLVKGETSREVLVRSIRYAIERFKLVKELRKALAEIKTLSGLLPICSFCAKVRDDKGYWNKIETYIKEHADVDFSHSICPECLKSNYPEFYNELEDEI